MQDLFAQVRSLKRPKLLVSAARFGLEAYNRRAALPRLLGGEPPERPGQAMVQLLDREAELEAQRASRAADYSIATHVETLIALMGEASLLQDMTRAR